MPDPSCGRAGANAVIPLEAANDGTQLKSANMWILNLIIYAPVFKTTHLGLERRARVRMEDDQQ